MKQFVAIGVGSYKQSFDPLIYPDNRTFNFGVGDINLIREIQIPLFVFKKDFGVLPVVWKRTWIIKSNKIRPEGYSFFGSGKVSHPNYRDRRFSVCYKTPFLMLGSLRFIGSGNNSEKRAGKLRRKFKFFSYSCIVYLCKFIGVDFFRFKNYFGKPIKSYKPVWKDLVGFMGAVEFEFDGPYSFHIY